jgi:hypothetical protein
MDLLNSYLEFADPKERQKFKAAEAYIDLYRRALQAVKQSPETPAKKKAGFKAQG